MSDDNSNALYLYGIVRARTWRALERKHPQVQRVRYRDIEAVVRPIAFEMANESEMAEHQQLVDEVMRHTTILPVPFGIVFRSRRAVIHLLQEQYLVMDEGLGVLDGHWELRLHISGNAAEETEQTELANTIYGELRRFARAAVPFPSDAKRLLSAAFLVDRTTWVEFIERIEDYDEQNAALTFDITGPWPAYDFVRVVS
jgi:hypothetical protein